MASSGYGQSDGSVGRRAIRGRPALRRFPLLPPDGFERLAAQLGDLRLRLAAVFEREMEAGRGFLWLPVCFGAGILVYFALPAEPSAVAVGGLALALAIATWRRRRSVALFRTLFALAAVAAGLAAMKLRTDAATSPMLRHETTATITGWVAARESTPADGVRVTLRVASLSGLKPEETPYVARITIRTRAAAIAVGDAISVKARLQAPSGPVLPGGYDFGLVSFYDRIGAVGFAYGGAKPADLGPPPLGIRVTRPVAALRETIRQRIDAALPGDNGRIAASLIMGDQLPISEKTQDAMRASGLGHVLSISGLHMALVAGSVFWLVRASLALSARLTLTRPIKKWAAAAALAATLVYVGISGGGIATDRSFIMIAIMLIAVILDRAALTLRNVAIAAGLILLAWPESLLSISFQMSFAATVALVAGYEAFRTVADRRLKLSDAGAFGVTDRLRHAATGLFATAVLAGLATTPFAAFYFQRVAPLTLIANIMAMPVVDLIVMPMALATAILMPFGLETAPLAVMSRGIDWMTFVAAKTAEWSQGLGGVPMAPSLALLLTVTGFLWLALWRERWRLAGAAPLLAALPIALLAPRPDILIDARGTAAAVRGADGRYQIIGGKDAKFEVENWLRADADLRPPDAADLAKGVACDALGCVAKLADGSEVALVKRPDAFDEDCRSAAVVVTRFRPPPGCTTRATVIDETILATGGAEALYRLPAGPPETPTSGAARPRFRIEAAYPPIRRRYMPPLESAAAGGGGGQ